eukprot:6355119-Pyramimonas_sp.AAC.1
MGRAMPSRSLDGKDICRRLNTVVLRVAARQNEKPPVRASPRGPLRPRAQFDRNLEGARRGVGLARGARERRTLTGA